MFIWEIKKLCGRFTLYFTTVMLCLAVVLTIISNADSLTSAGDEIRQAQDRLLWEYKNDRESYDMSFTAYESQLKEYEAWYDDLIYGDTYPGEFVWQNRLVDTHLINKSEYGDRELFKDVLSVINAAESYGGAIDRLLSDTYIKLNDSGIRRGEYLYEYQVNTVLRYEKLRDLQFEPHFTRGWDDYFSSSILTILLTLTIIRISVQNFIMEKRVRILPILHVSKRGEKPLRIAKISALFCVTVFQCLMFSLLPLLVYSFTTGLSNPVQPMQTVSGFLYCPYELSILECLVFVIIGRIFIAFTLAIIVSVIGQVSGSEIITFAVMLVYLFMQLLTERISEASRFIGWKRYSLFNVLEFGIFFERYRAVNFMGIHIPSVIFISVAAFLLLLAGIILSLIAGGCISGRKFKKFLRNKERKRSVRTYAPSLFLFEMRKLCLNRRIICVLLGAFAVRGIIAYINFSPSAAAEDQILRMYYNDLASLGGIPGEDTDLYISNEMNFINNCTMRYEDMIHAYYDGVITQTDFNTYKAQYNYASTAWKAWMNLSERQSYLSYMGEAHTDLRYINKEGIIGLLLPDMDFVYILCLLIVVSPVISSECQSGFSVILRASKKGRYESFCAKLLCVVLFSVFIQLVFNMLDLWVCIVRFGLPDIKASIYSLPEFRELEINTSITGYYALTRTVSLAGGVILSLLCYGISGICYKTYHSSLFSLTSLSLPYLLSFSDISLLKLLNIRTMLCPESIKEAFITTAIYGIVVTVLLLKSGKKWSKE